jgi:hypothetical protein
LKFSDNNTTNSGIQFADKSYLYTTTNLVKGIINNSTIILTGDVIVPNLTVTNNLTVSNLLRTGNAIVTNSLTVSNLFLTGNAIVTNNLTVSNQITTKDMYVTNIYFSNGTSMSNANNLSSEAFNHRMYVYTPSNVITVLAGTVGTTQFTVPTQQVGCIHVGMYISNAAIFSAASKVTAVDWTNNRITIDKAIIATINPAGTTASAVATGSSSSVTFTHTVPAGYSRCKVTVTGSGATGGSDNGTSVDSGSGGGAGGTAICFLKLEAGSSVAITVGKRAAIATSGGDGNNGNASSFGSYCTAYGGNKGKEADDSDGGYGGSAYGGAINIVGGQGEPWDWYGSPTSGGASFFGGGVASRRDVAPYGAGGSGWRAYYVHNNSGCAGDGILIIEYY